MTIDELQLADGNYTVEVTMEGGSGRATIESPTALSVEDGQATAQITWSSNHYDYMIVGGEKYLPVSTEEHSVFEIPVDVFDEEIEVIGDTTAMSTPHEVEYTLTFVSDSIKGENGGSTGGSGSTTAAAGIVIIVVAAAIAATVMRKKRNTKA